MRYGPRPAPDGVVLHTVMHCLHGVGPEACLHLVNRWLIGAWALMGWTVCVNFVQSSERCNLKKLLEKIATHSASKDLSS